VALLSNNYAFQGQGGQGQIRWVKPCYVNTECAYRCTAIPTYSSLYLFLDARDQRELARFIAFSFFVPSHAGYVTRHLRLI
jgi:hypothetical protein